jgi:Skp family chaperone for outer membrane proteins
MNLKTILRKPLISFLTFSILVSSCGSDSKKEKKDTKPKVEARDTKGLKIAFYSNDSIKEKFEYYKREDASVTKKQKAFQSELEKRSREYDNFVQRKDQEARNGLLSENEIMLAQQKAQQMQASIMQYQQTQGAKIEEETVKKLEAINKKIEALGKKYCELHGIDILLMHGQGGQLNYITPSMDVTNEFINFLNENQGQIEKELK